MNASSLTIDDVVDVTEAVMEAIQGMTNLKKLSIKGVLAHMPIIDTFNENGICQYLPPGLTELNLEGQPDLTNVGLIGDDVTPWPESLTSLTLSRTAVTHEGLKLLVDTPLLQYLDLSNCDDLECIDCLPKIFPTLLHLDLTGCHLFGTDWGPLLAMQSLQTLKVTNSDMAEEDWQYLQKLTNLEVLEISLATDRNVKWIKDLPIACLSLCGGRFALTDKGLQTLQTLPLTALTLSGCQNVTAGGLAHLKTLRTLCLTECPGFIEEDLVKLSLEKLTVARCKHIPNRF
jgi:hypothetical protein